jgi:hypothetical protein
MIYGCVGCGCIYAPRHAPARCTECDGTLTTMTIDAALDLARERQDRLRAKASAILLRRPNASRPPASL